MRPATVHCVAQLVRHSRGLLTTIEKWVAATPPDQLHEEAAQLLGLMRGSLTDVITTLETTGEGHVTRSDSRVLQTR